MRQLFLLLLFAQQLTAQVTVGQLLRDFAADASLNSAAIGLSVVDAKTGQSLGSVNSGVALIPASTQKLFTTAAALYYLGEEHRFTTQLTAEGELTDSGELIGNLRIVGGGDPSLGSPYQTDIASAEAVIGQWVAAARRYGIRKIRGGVIGDGRYFGTDGAGGGWPWADLGNYYGSGAYGLNFHENFYFLDLIQRSQLGSRPMIRGARPQGQTIRFSNELVSGPKGSGDQAYIYGAPFSGDYHVRGSIPVGSGRFTIRGSVPEPALWTAEWLHDALTAADIPTTAPATAARKTNDATNRPGSQIWVNESPPLLALIDRTNRKSNNLYAEALLRAINKSRGKAIHELSSTELVTVFLENQGVDVSGVQLADGSGLDPRNFFPPRTMTAFLVEQTDATAWRTTLPEITTGVFAKSGSLNAASCYAGYVRRADGRELAFAFMVNNFTAEGKAVRAKLKTLMQQLRTVKL